MSLGIVRFEGITHGEITNLIGIQPTLILKKGDLKNLNNLTGPIRKYNHWIYEVPLSNNTSFEEQMACLLDIIEPKIGVLKILAEKHTLEISCVLYVYAGTEESTPSIHLDSRYRNVLKEVNIEFDLDLYCFS